MTATAGRYFVNALLRGTAWRWAWVSEWPDGSFATLSTGLWGRYRGRP